MTLNDLIRDRGRVFNLLDLVELMEKFDLPDVYQMLGIIASVSGPNNVPADDDDGSGLALGVGVCLANFKSLCHGLGLDVAEAHAVTLEGLLGYHTHSVSLLSLLNVQLSQIKNQDTPEYTSLASRCEATGTDVRHWHSKIRQTLEKLGESFSIQTTSRMFFYLTPNQASLWSDPLDKWKEVIAVLDAPNAKDKLVNSTVEAQIIEANRCLATGRGTACVLHLNNVLEIGMKRLRRKIPGKNDSLRELDGFIKAIEAYTNRTTTPSDAKQMQSVAASCVAVRVAWRHPAAHGDMIFTEEAASEVYTAICGLMQEIIKL